MQSHPFHSRGHQYGADTGVYQEPPVYRSNPSTLMYCDDSINNNNNNNYANTSGCYMKTRGRIYRQVCHAPEPPPNCMVTRRRLETPPPDILEHIIVVKPQRQIFHEIIEQPTQPRPVVRKRFVTTRPDPPQYQTSTVCVNSRSSLCLQSSPVPQVSPAPMPFRCMPFYGGGGTYGGSQGC